VGHDRPEVVTVGKAREIVGEPIVASITGADASAAADSAHDAFQKFLDSEKK
jgi:multiple sugar transport system substrate-binding protein